MHAHAGVVGSATAILKDPDERGLLKVRAEAEGAGYACCCPPAPQWPQQLTIRCHVLCP